MNKPNERDWDIDPYALDKELLRQASLTYHWAERQADAQRDQDEAKAKLDVTRANLDLDVRSNPEAYGIAKISEKTVESAVLTQQAYQDGLREIAKARHDLDVFKAAVQACEHKKRALEKLVDLFLAGYFGEPKINNDNKAEVDEMQKRAIRKKGRREKRESDDGGKKAARKKD